jgi:putative membrane protein
MMWGYGYGGGSWVGWLVMGIMMLVFWGLVVAGVIFLVRYLGHGRDQRGGGDALRILDERFARGEIDADEYSRRRQLLSSP